MDNERVMLKMYYNYRSIEVEKQNYFFSLGVTHINYYLIYLTPKYSNSTCNKYTFLNYINGSALVINITQNPF